MTKEPKEQEKNDAISGAIMATLSSPNVVDSNWEDANVVDVLDRIAQATHRVSTAISSEASAGTDATDGKVECLVEAMMGVTAGLVAVAESIRYLADARG